MMIVTPDGTPHLLLLIRSLAERRATFEVRFDRGTGVIRVALDEWECVPEHYRHGASAVAAR